MMTPDAPPPREVERFDPDKLFSDAVDALRATAESAVIDAEAHDARLRAVRQQLRDEGRHALVEALLSELEAAKPDFLALLGPNGMESQVITARATWKAFADHIRQWLDAGAPERPVLDRAWELINAQGGTGPPTSFHRGYCKAIEVSLVIIERLGGMDPARRKAAAK